jgi:glycosyl hydrolase family 18 (putative chitinase)
MPSRNIIWCQTSDASVLAKVRGKKYTHVIIAALHLHCEGGKYVMYLNDTRVDQIGKPFWDTVELLQKDGVTVTALLGGAGGGNWSCITQDPSQAISAMKPLVNTYPFQGFDLDWEYSEYDPNAPSYDAKFMATYTSQLAKMRQGLVITHAPTTDLLPTYTADIWKFLATSLSWINVQWYGNNLLQVYTDFVSGRTSGAPVDPTRVVAGAAVVRQVGVGYTDLCQLMSMVTTLQQRSGIGQKFGGVAGWEFTQTLNSTDPKVSNWDTCIAAALQGQTKCVACK